MYLKKIVLISILLVCLPFAVQSSNLYLEDINFPFNSSIVVDDLGQAPRIAVLLNDNPDLFIEIIGHADSMGPPGYNIKLSHKRALAVKEMLISHNVSPDKIHIKVYGEDRPKENNITDEGRYINRRVVFNIYALQNGKKVYYFQDNNKLQPLPGEPKPGPQKAAMKIITNDIMKRLDDLEAAVKETKKPAAVETTGSETKPIPPGRSLSEHADNRGSFSARLGSDDGEFTGDIQGKLFIPLNDLFALQGGLRGALNDKRNEYQLDAGMVGRHQRFQLGLFGSVMLADNSDYEDTGYLSQLNLTTSYLFERGSIGAFMTEGIKSEDVISRTSHYELTDLITTETYIEIRDKYGINFDYIFHNNFFMDGNLAWINADDSDVTGRIRVGYPLPSFRNLNVFIEGSYHDSGLIGDSDDFAIMAGLELSNCLYKNKPADKIRPMQVSPISYEIKKRTKVLEAGINLVPIVSISASATSGPPPLTVSFTGNATDRDGTITDYKWDFGDGTTGSGQTVSHIFTSPDTFLVTLTVTDNDGDTSSATITISTVNLLPQVSISASPINGGHPLTVSFSGTAVDPDGSIAGYEWDFGDGSSGAGQSLSHTYTSVGTFLVTLTATDDDGGAGVDTMQITVSNTDPVSSAGLDQTHRIYSITLLFTPYEISLDGSGSFDPDNDPVSYEWRQISGPGVVLVNADTEAPGFNPPCQDAVYEFRLTVSDPFGGISYDTVLVTVTCI
ncbi:MAG: PKD domain-containing protein [Desulfobacterales bacterium]|nr:PKD domain-containing protein [Desulfobacterales bacterium]